MAYLPAILREVTRVIILFPVGVEDAEVNRLPWVSIGIAGLCCIAFVFSWVLPEHPTGIDNESVAELVRYWSEHSYLRLPEAFQSRFVPSGARSHFQWRSTDAKPDEETLEKEQATLEAMVARAISRAEGSLLRRFSLVPARGFSQIGWLTHMFLHFGWLHLLGNLFFFYLVGPMIEDIWGRPLFAGFYLTGGLGAAFAQVLLDRASPAMMVGASGAIAACMGAFALRYATRRVRLAYFVWLYFRIWRGTTLWPAWVCGLLWFLNEAWNFWRTGGNSSVAMMAHMGGFAFGAAIAFGLRASGIESKYVAPKVEATFTWQQHPAVQTAEAALERKDLAAASAAYRQALAADAKNLEAQFGLAKIALLEGRTTEGAQRLDSLLNRVLASSERDQAVNWVEDLLPHLDPKQLRPVFAYKIAQVLEAAPEGLRPKSEQFYARVAEGGGVLGAKASLRAAAMALSAPDRAEAALRHLATAASNPELPPDCKVQLSELRAKAERRRTIPPITEPAFQPSEPHPAFANGSPSSSYSPESRLHSRPKIVPCRLKRMGEDGLELEVDSKSARVAWSRVMAIGVGIVPDGAPGGPQKNVVVTDLVVSTKTVDGAPTVLRIPGGALELEALFPGVRARDAFHRLIAELLSRSRAKALPTVDGLSSGNYPRFADIAALESAFYGAAA